RVLNAMVSIRRASPSFPSRIASRGGSEADSGDVIQRRRLPVGILGCSGATGSGLALRGSTGMAPRPYRADRAGRAVHRARLHPAEERAWIRVAIPSLRDAVRA